MLDDDRSLDAQRRAGHLRIARRRLYVARTVQRLHGLPERRMLAARRLHATLLRTGRAFHAHVVVRRGFSPVESCVVRERLEERRLTPLEHRLLRAHPAGELSEKAVRENGRHGPRHGCTSAM
jgi:hypothetical protein